MRARLALYTQFNRDAIGIWPKAIGQRSDLDRPHHEGHRARPIARHPVRFAGLLRGRFLHVDSEPRCLPVRSAALAAQSPARAARPHWTSSTRAVRTSATCCSTARTAKLTAMPYIDLVNEMLADAISSARRSELHHQSAVEADVAEQDRRRSCAPRPNTSTRPPTSRCSARTLSAHAAVQRGPRRAAHVPRKSRRSRSGSCARRCCRSTSRRSRSRRRSPSERCAWRRTKWISSPRRISSRRPSAGTSAAPADDRSASVPAFLQAASITYESLLELLQCAWVQGGTQHRDPGHRRHLRHERPGAGARRRSTPASSTARIASCALWRRTDYQDVGARSAACARRASATARSTRTRWSRSTRSACCKTRPGLAVDQQLAFFQDIDTTIASRSGRHVPRHRSTRASSSIRPLPRSHPDRGSGGAALPAASIAHPNLHRPPRRHPGRAGYLGRPTRPALFGLTDNQLTLANLRLHLSRQRAGASAAKLSLGRSVEHRAGCLNPAAAT